MYSSDKKFNQCISSFSGPKNALQDLCKNEKIKVTAHITKADEEFESTKKSLNEDLDEMFKHNKFDPEKSLKDLKYKLEALKKENKDYKLLKISLGLNLKNKETIKNYIKIHCF